jgi:hypothetical protein
MKLYTIQHIEVYKALKKQGFYATNTNYICEENFQEAYDWLAKMARKHKKFDCNGRPIWCWTKRPDMRTYKFISDPSRPKKEKYVLLTLEVPANRVLLSEFGLWHCVLNKSPVVLNSQEDKQWDKLLKPYGGYIGNKTPQKIIKLMEKSWEKIIFKDSTSFKNFDKKWIGKVQLQATIDKIDIDQVLKVEYFNLINKSKITS